MDASPLVAFFVKNESRHRWAVEQFSKLSPPVLLCEPVLTEACFLLQRGGVDPRRLLDKIFDRAFEIRFSLEKEIDAVGKLLHRYKNLPMSLADACLVRMAELHEGACVATLDTHFRIYRKHGRKVIPLLMPD